MLAIAPVPAAAYLHYPADVGGVRCVVGDVEFALECLYTAPGLMVRQPLERAGSPLACCDYHAVAAPYKEQYRGWLQPHGRGAAGRHVTKRAFCHALGVIVAVARSTGPVAAFAGVTQRAWDAFARDFGYAEAIARSAVLLGSLVGDCDNGAASAALRLEVQAV
jgi:hypothetical protein